MSAQDRIFHEYQNDLLRTRNNVLREARSIIQQDLGDPQRTGRGVDHEAYFMRANHMGLGVLKSGLISLGIEVYQIFIEEIKQFRERTGEARHLGTAYANLATAHFCVGNIDYGVTSLLNAANEDFLTAGIQPDNTYALREMMAIYFSNPIFDYLIQTIHLIDVSKTREDIISFYTSLGDRGYIFLAYVWVFRENILNQRKLPTEYNYWQIFSALRNISAIFEVEIKDLGGNQSLSRSISQLYETKPWWGDYTNTKNLVGEYLNSQTPPISRLNQALSISTTNNNELFWKSLLLSLITKNYTVHEMNPVNILSVENLELIMAHIVYSLISAPSFI